MRKSGERNERNSSPIREPAAKSKKTRMKEAKETRQLFEAIAKKLLEEAATKSNHKLELFCMDYINKKFTEVRSDITIIESALSARINSIEGKVSDINSKLAEMSVDTYKQNSLLRDEIKNVLQHSTAEFETERSKRSIGLRKLQAFSETSFEHCKTLVNTMSNENKNLISSLSDDFRVYSKDTVRLKEQVDEM